MNDIQFIFFLLVGFIAMAGDLVVPVFLAKKYPGYSHLYDTISELGSLKSPVHKYQSLWLAFVGLLLIIFAFGQGILFSSYDWHNVLYLFGIIIFGTGTIIAGIFPEDSKGEVETLSGKVHGISSGLGFLFLLFNPLNAIWIYEFRDLKTFNIIIFISGVLSFIIFVFSKNNKGLFGLSGLWQRINLVILYLHLVLNYAILGLLVIANRA